MKWTFEVSEKNHKEGCCTYLPVIGTKYLVLDQGGTTKCRYRRNTFIFAHQNLGNIKIQKFEPATARGFRFQTAKVQCQ